MASSAYSQPISAQDTFNTELGTLTVHPIFHGSVALTVGDKTIFVDPYGGAERFAQLPAPDFIFITDIHGDHLHRETINGLNLENTTFVVPQAVADQLADSGYKMMVIGNGESMQISDFEVEAIPMYNMPGDESVRHVKGRGNGYVLNVAGTKVYFSGDTEDIPEMRALKDIDIAFVCMNLPYTMDINQASSAVIEFKPAVMYPYHHRGQDMEEFKRIVDSAIVGVDVRLRNWYTE